MTLRNLLLMSREGDGEICVVYNWLYAALCCVLYAASSDSRVVKQLGASDHSVHWHLCIALVPWHRIIVKCRLSTALVWTRTCDMCCIRGKTQGPNIQMTRILYSKLYVLLLLYISNLIYILKLSD